MFYACFLSSARFLKPCWLACACTTPRHCPQWTKPRNALECSLLDLSVAFDTVAHHPLNTALLCYLGFLLPLRTCLNLLWSLPLLPPPQGCALGHLFSICSLSLVISSALWASTSEILMTTRLIFLV